MTNLGSQSACEIWAVGGGKGGTGKSYIISSVGHHLAAQGHRVILIDADLGGANLHSFFGIPKPSQSLTHFFTRRLPLSDLIVDTGISDIGLITGDIHSLDSHDVKYTQQLKLFRSIKGLDTDYILIDLGAGAHYKTIDTFLIADKMLVVSVPEIIAIENLYHFVKNVLFRKIKMVVMRNGYSSFFKDIWKNKEAYGIGTLKELIAYLRNSSTCIRDLIDRELSCISIYLILNQVKYRHELKLGPSISSVLTKLFGLNAQYAGYIPYEDSFSRSIAYRRPLLRPHGSFRLPQAIARLTENLLNGRQRMASEG